MAIDPADRVLTKGRLHRAQELYLEANKMLKHFYAGSPEHEDALKSVDLLSHEIVMLKTQLLKK